MNVRNDLTLKIRSEVNDVLEVMWPVMWHRTLNDSVVWIFGVDGEVAVVVCQCLFSLQALCLG